VARNSVPAAAVFPQAMPLDLLLHYDLPRFISTGFNTDILTAERILGALEAAALGGLAVGFARALALDGAAAVAVVAAAVFGGYLGLFTGYGKSLRELVVVVAAVATFGVKVARSGRGLAPLGLAAAAGLALHRSALGLLPACAVAMALGFRRHPSLRRAQISIALGIGAPLVALLLLAGKIVAAMRSTDAAHLALASGAGPALSAALAPDHLREVANVVLALAPLAAAAAVVAPFARMRPERDGAGAVLFALALPFVAVLLLVHPRQGMFRDWDVFSPAAAALAALAALALGRALSDGAGRAGLALATALAALVPTVQWLWLEHDFTAGFPRIRAYLAGPPPRPVPDRSLTWDYLGTRLNWLDSLDASAEAHAHAAALTPSPRLLYLWAQAEAARKDYGASRTILLRLTTEAVNWAGAWGALAFVSQQMRDTTAARAAAARALALDPDDELARSVMRALPPPGTARAPR
jgi:tetratricopeptide (TPR) repeat protein